MSKVYSAPKELRLAFGRVAVIFGGCSAEREVSLNSGRAVLEALKGAGIAAFALDYNGDVKQIIEHQPFDRAFLALHGRGGEDGTIQGVLDSLGIPYTGSGVMGSAIGMDKMRTKLIWKGLNLPTPSFGYVDELDAKLISQLVSLVKFPLAVKPAREGSSIGVFKVTEQAQLDSAIESALELDQQVLLEQWIDGPEYTVGILGKETLPVIGLKVASTFYDYDAKYTSSSTQYMLPSGLSPEEEKQITSLALQAFDAVGCSGWGRVDVMRGHDGRFWLLEVNTIPGMTDHSLVPMAAAHKGMSMSELVTEILRQTLNLGGMA